jgi:lipoprotein-anchoring transpeptidase ErfK/SrfK
MKRLWLTGIFVLAAVALLLCSCAPIPPYIERALPVEIPLFAPKPGGWWHDDGVSGEPKIVVHIGEQKAFFYKGKHLVGVSDVSTGKPGFSTPPGRYQVIAKDRDHVSTVFGDYVDDYGNVVKFNIDVRKDHRPPATHFDGARMPYAMFFRGGYAMHEGYVPPYAASHGCIRLPKGMAEHFFDAAGEGTTMIVKE